MDKSATKEQIKMQAQKPSLKKRLAAPEVKDIIGSVTGVLAIMGAYFYFRG